MSSSTSNAHIIILGVKEKLSTKLANWPEFKLHTLMILREWALLGVVTGTDPKPADGADAKEVVAWKEKDGKAVTQIGLNLTGDLVLDLPESSKKIWDKLIARFEHKSVMNQMVVMDYLNAKKMTDGEDTWTYFNKIDKRKYLAIAAGTKIETNQLIMIYIKSLSDVYDSLVGTLYNLTSPEQVINTVLMEETRQSTHTTTTQEVALKAQGRSMYFCSNCKKPGHTVDHCWSLGGGREGQVPPGWKPRRSKQSANLASTEPKYFALVSATNENTAPNAWYADSGATSHMMHDHSVFSTYTGIPHHPITSATPDNPGSLHAVGCSDVVVKSMYGGSASVVTLRNVLHVPNISANLVSVSQFEDAGTAHALITVGTIAFSRGEEIFASAKCEGGQYHMDWDMIKSAAFLSSSNADVSTPLELWHRRLGHVGEQDILEMFRHNSGSGSKTHVNGNRRQMRDMYSRKARSRLVSSTGPLCCESI